MRNQQKHAELPISCAARKRSRAPIALEISEEVHTFLVVYPSKQLFSTGVWSHSSIVVCVHKRRTLNKWYICWT